MTKLTCKWLLLVVITSTFFCVAKAAGDTLYYTGKIIISKNVSYAYNLRFAINSNNKITGYSLTDAGGANETKVKIAGSYDSLKNTISFEEKNILRTRVDQNQNDLCFVKTTLTFKYAKLVEETLTGKFSGFKPGSNTPCASGEIKLINARKGQSLREKVDKFYERPPKKEDTSQAATEIKVKEKVITVADNRGTTLAITGDAVQLTIWDNGKIDGDKISVMLNDTYLLENYTLDSAKKIINAPLTTNATDTITVIALNEGKIAPNTAMIKIESTTESYPIEVRAALNEERKIYLKKKDNAAEK